MAYSDLTVTSYVNIMGYDFIAYVDVEITSLGSPATYSRQWGSYDPPEAPDWDINEIRLQLDDLENDDRPIFKTTGKLFLCLCNLATIQNDVSEAAQDECASLVYTRRRVRGQRGWA